ncbi:MAG: glucokinase [Deltaproteobacteria bacterium]|jgi:glucokinase|nr:glucokinase [Deltaproteobacteria bacterium]
MDEEFLLAADIGGTHSRFALFRLEGAPAGVSLSMVRGSKLVLKTAASKSFKDLLARLRVDKTPGGFTLLGDYKPAAACLAVPAVISDKNQDAVFHAPNIAWPLKAADFFSISRFPCVLINDFAAQGLAGLFPDILGLRPVLDGSAREEFPLAMLGAGTGLGKAVILPPEQDPEAGREPGAENGRAAANEKDALFIPGGRVDRGRVLPSEGGHGVFPFKGREEADFQEFLLRMTGRGEAVGDMVVTGAGLSALYAFHNGDNFLRPAPEIAAAIGEALASGADAADPLLKSLDWLAGFLGRAARNQVLEVLALGGVYLSGGMLEHVPALPGRESFAEEFRGSESQRELVKEIPVSRVSSQETGLWGAALNLLK